MNAIVHHKFRAQRNIIHKEGQQRQIVSLGQLGKDLFELAQIAGTVVAGQLDLGQHHTGLLLLGERDHAGQILAGNGRCEAAQAIVAPQFNQQPVRLVLLQQSGQTGQRPLCRFTADAGIEQGVFSPLLLPFLVEQGRPALLNLHLIAGAQAVSQHQQGLGLSRREQAAEANKQGKQNTHHQFNSRYGLSSRDWNKGYRA